MECRDEVGRDNAHESREYDELRVDFAQIGSQLALGIGAFSKRCVIDGPCRDTGCAGTFPDRSTPRCLREQGKRKRISTPR